MPRSSYRHLLTGTVTLLLAAAVAYAGKPQSWTFNSQKDYTEGKFQNTVVDSYGDLMLGRGLAPIETSAAAELVSAFAQAPDGTVYAAAGPEGKIYRLDPDGHKSTVIYTVPKGFTDITAMACDTKGNLLVALSGETAKLVEVNPKGENASAATRFENKDVTYIWAIRQAPDGAIYLGTGPHGKVYKLSEGESAGDVLLETGQKNVTALGFDHDGNLIAGTDSHGLVIRIDGKTRKPFVLLDAGKVDVNALVTDGDGNLYVATAKAQLTPEMGDNAGLSEGAPSTHSKPDAPEKEPIEPPADDDNNTPAGGEQGAASFGSNGLYFCVAPPSHASSALAHDLAQMLREAAGDQAARHAPGNHSPTRHLGRRRRLPPTLQAEGDEGQQDTSAVFRISPEGVVKPLVQDGGLNYAMVLVGNDLLIGTGDEGKLFRYRLSDHSLALIARVKEQQISAMLAGANGKVFLGTGNMGQVYELGAGPAPKGTFTSQVMDASHTAFWGHVALDDATPEGTGVLVETRSGNTQDVDANPKFWSDWIRADAGGGSLKIHSPAARFLQVRLTLTGSGKGESAATPVVNSWKVGYQTQNLAPRIRDLSVDLPGASKTDDAAATDPDTAAASDDATPAVKVAHLNWDASDPNNDTLVFRLYYRHAPGHTPSGDSEAAGDPWTPLARNVKDTTYDWDTRSVPDGRYQVKVVVSDSPDNPAGQAIEMARTSAPIIINHTPPAISDLVGSAQGNRAKVSGNTSETSGLTAVVDVRYQVDGQGDWQPAAASDKIFDSPQEAFTIVTRPLSAGPHRITVRATDAAGNNSYKVVMIEIKP